MPRKKTALPIVLELDSFELGQLYAYLGDRMNKLHPALRQKITKAVEATYAKTDPLDLRLEQRREEEEAERHFPEPATVTGIVPSRIVGIDPTAGATIAPELPTDEEDLFDETE